MIGAVDIIAAKVAWETTEWGGLTPPLRAFSYFPTEDDIAGDLPYPYSCHQVQSSVGAPQSINHMGSTEDVQTHVIWTYIMFASAEGAAHLLAARDAEWRDRYRAGFLKHLMNSMVGGGGIAENTMGMIEPVEFNLFGREEMGIKVPSTITIRQTMTTGN